MGVLTEKGFKRPSYDEIVERQIQRAKVLFGQNIETGEQTALGKFIRIICGDLSEMYEDLEGAYYSRFPNTASGVSLDRLCVFAGVSRNPPVSAVHKIKVFGNKGYSVPAGFLVGTEDDINFYNVYETVIGNDNYCEITIQAVDFGESGNVPVGDITKIINPVAEITSIEHMSVISYGANEESDRDLRRRFALAIAGAGSATAEAIRGNVMRVEGVKSAVVIENDSDIADKYGRPPHTFECYVNTDDLSAAMNDNIARAVFAKKPVGIRSFGDSEVNISDESGNSNLIYFTRIQKVYVIISAIVAVTNKFEKDGLKIIKDNLVKCINSLGNGEDVIFSSLYSYIYSVKGVKEVTELDVNVLGGEKMNSRIPLLPSQTAYLTEDNITIEVADYDDR